MHIVLLINSVAPDVQGWLLIFKRDLAAHGDVRDQVEAAGGVVIEDEVEVTIVNDAAYVEKLLGNHVLYFLQLLLHIEIGMFLHELAHGLINDVFRVFSCEFLQVLTGHD